LGKGVYKIRLGSSDLAKGKRSVYRIISYVTDAIEKVRLLTIYIKPSKATITVKDVVLGCRLYSQNVVVVDDGSTDTDISALF